MCLKLQLSFKLFSSCDAAVSTQWPCPGYPIAHSPQYFKMFFKLPFLLTILSVLVSTAQASPILVERATSQQPACPTASRWEATYVEFLPPYTLTFYITAFSSGIRTHTEYETYHGTHTTLTTVISPGITTIPGELFIGPFLSCFNCLLLKLN
jgi:hypothetical protein